MCREGLELDQSSSGRTRQGGAKAFQIRVRLHGQKPKQQLADVPERPRESNELGQLNSIRTRQVSTKAFQIRVRLHEQKPKQQLADVSERLREGNELGQLNSIRTQQISTTALHFRAHTTDKNQNSNWQMCQRGVGMAMNSVSRKASERGKPAQRRCTSVRRCTDKNQNSNWRVCQRSVGKVNELGQPKSIRTRQASAKTLHIRAQMHGQEPKQQLADVPKKRREGNELGQPRSIRTRQVSERRRTSVRSCTDKSQNSNWRMCQRGVGKATNSVSRTASECAQVSAKALHIRAQLHGQEPKQQLADVPKRRRDGNELGQPKSVRARQVSAK